MKREEVKTENKEIEPGASAIRFGQGPWIIIDVRPVLPMKEK